MRTRIALGVVAAFVILSAVSAVTFSWYGYRVYSEMTPGSWRSPTEILDRNGKTLAALYGAEWRVAEPVVLADLPSHVPNAFLAAEDIRFRRHPGIDPIGIGRAAFTNIAAGGVAEGGSTLTQQLAKMRFLSNERTWTRKTLEAGLAVMIELRLSKDEILEAYLNEVYLGHRDGREVRGLGEGARVYFGKTPAKLTVAEAAMMAGMIRAPNRDNPDDRLRIARQRRDAVLGVMKRRKWISDDQENRARRASAKFDPGSRRLRPHPYLLAAIRQELVDRIGERKLHRGGVRIHTAVDQEMQVAAERAVRTGTQRLRASHSWLRRRKPLQAALLSVDPATGGVRALVGGSDFKRSQFDRTRRMRRQPGSAAKPFTYAAAIESRTVTPSTAVDDSPLQVRLASNRTWEPKNYDQQFRGPVTVREAFEKSLNVPAVRVATSVGVGRVRETLQSVGFGDDLSQTPAIALGVDDVTMRELVAAYSVFPNLGSRTDPHIIVKVTDRGGDELYSHEARRIESMDPAVAYVIHTLMRGVVVKGTAASLNASGLGYVAGKTGTTSNYRDAWFVGYTQDLLTAVWVGFDDGNPLRISSGQAAIPIWAAFMTKVPHSEAQPRAPRGVTIMEVEAFTGRLWQPGCGPAVSEVFLTGTEPRENCGGYFDESQIYVEFDEPPMMTDEMAMDMSVYDQRYQVQTIDDPDAIMLDSLGDEDDPDEPIPLPDTVLRRSQPRPVPTPPLDSIPPVDDSISGDSTG